MARRHKKKGSRRSKGTGARGEWIGALVEVPTYVVEDGEPERPDGLFWMAADGTLLGAEIGPRGEVLGEAGAHLRRTIEEPMTGPPHAPKRVRVASPALAAVLRASHPDVEIVCAPTPEIDEALELLWERMQEADGEPESYLEEGVDPQAMAACFRALAALYRADPWEVARDEGSYFFVTIESLGVRDSVISLVGEVDEECGLLLLPSIAEFDQYVGAAIDLEYGSEPDIPEHFTVSFEHEPNLPSALRAEIDHHGWEVAGPSAYPRLGAIANDLFARGASSRELIIIEAISRALAEVVPDAEALEAAFSEGEPYARTLVVKTHAGEIEVLLRVDPAAFDDEEDLLRDLLGELAILANAADADDLDLVRAPIEDELVRQFKSSPEAEGLEDVEDYRHVMDFAAKYFGETIATLEAQDLREIVFEIMPRKVAVQAPSEATRMLAGIRAFYRFLGREFGVPQLDECLAVLGPGTERKLERALADPSKLPMPRSLFMRGLEFRFDMDSPGGRKRSSRSTPDSGGFPPSPFDDLDLEPDPRGGSKPAKKARNKEKRRPSGRRGK